MKVDTRISKNSPTVSTELKLDWSGVSNEEKLELATRTVVISWQRIARDSGKIPTKADVKVRDILDGKRPPRVASKERVLADAAKLSPAELEAAIAELRKLSKPAKPAAKKPGAKVGVVPPATEPKPEQPAAH